MPFSSGEYGGRRNAVSMPGEPALPVFAEVVAGPVVDDEEDLPPRAATNELLEEREESAAVGE
jgi:hypothetical protein